MPKKKVAIKIIRVFCCADINHDCVVAKLLDLGKRRKNVNDIHGTGEFYSESGESYYVIYQSKEEQSLWDVCQVAGIPLDDDMKDEEE